MNLNTLLTALTGLWAITPDALNALVSDLPQLVAGAVPESRTNDDLATPTETPYSMDGPVAIVPVKGGMSKNGLSFLGFQLLASMREIGAALRQAAADPAVRAIMLDVESPGGTVDGTEELAAAVVAAGQSKPLYTYADGLMGSAAYWIACSAREIAAPATAQVGSVGVLLMHREVSRALDNAGVKVNIITAGRYKAAGNMAEPLSDEMRAYIQSNIDSVYELFLQAVEQGRQVTREKALAMADGKIFLAGDAQNMGLIDRVCSRTEFINKIQKDCTMTLSELKAQHPDAVQELRVELREALRAELSAENNQALDAARADASAVQDRVVALAGAIFGKDAGEKLKAVAASGVSAEMLATLQGVLGQPDSAKPNAQQEALAALAAATAKVPTSPMAAVGNAEDAPKQDFGALVEAHMQQHKCGRGDAIKAVATANPNAHKDWIVAQNAARK